MTDGVFDPDSLAPHPQPWKFRAKPLRARMLVICAGVIMNGLLAISIFWAISYVNGKVTKETTEIGYVGPETPAARAGLLQADKILSINSRAGEGWEVGEDQV